jgi:tetratricopeptide (TPR) repeat protein
VSLTTQACLDYAQYLLEPWELKIPEAERLLRQAFQTLLNTTSNYLVFEPPSSAKGDSERDNELLADIYFTLGRLYHLYRRESHSAIEYYLHTLKLQPDHYFGLLHHACLLSTSKLREDYVDADALFRKAFTTPGGKRADFVQILLYVQFLAVQMGDYGTAEEECMRALRTLPCLAVPGVAYAGLLANFVRTSRWSRKMYNRIADFFPKDPMALAAVGQVHVVHEHILDSGLDPTPGPSLMHTK